MTSVGIEQNQKMFAKTAGNPLVSCGDVTPSPDVEAAFCCVAEFSSALSNQSMIVGALRSIAATFQLAQVSVVRSLSGTFSGRRIAQCAPAAPVKLDLELLERVASDPDTQAGQFLSAAHCGDDATVMIVLRADVGSVDVLHMVLTPSTSDHALDMLTRLAPALTTAWSMRHPGFSKALLAAQRRTTRRQDMAPDAPILCVDNSYGLSRSEFRVCRLLETGLRPREIADELGLSIATIRTHLGNIYAKTELSGQLAVVSHLNGHRTVDAHAA